MRVLLVCLALAVVVQATPGFNDKLYVTYRPPGVDPERRASFFEIPRQRNTTDGWVYDQSVLRFPTTSSIWCRNHDYRLCAVYDLLGGIAGIQVAMSVEDFEKTNLPVSKYFERRTVQKTKVYSRIFHLVENNVLDMGGRKVSDTTTTATSGIYVNDGNGNLRKMELDERDMKNTLFVKQGCLPNMGRHYMFNISKETSCDDIELAFALYDETTHKLAGAGMILFGKSSPHMEYDRRTWLETVPEGITKIISPDSPECVHDLAKKHDLMSLHFYISEKPWTLTC